MATLTVNDVNALIALAISNNKQALISAMNSTGNSVASTISDDDLFNTVKTVFTKKGLDGLKSVFSRVPFIESKLTSDEVRNLVEKYTDANVVPVVEGGLLKGEWWKNLVQTYGDFLGGTSTVTQTPTVSTQTSAPVLSPKTLIYIAVFGVIAIVVLLIVFRKSLT